MGDSVDVTRLKIPHPNEVKDLSPRGGKVFLHREQVRLGEHVDQIVPGEWLRAISAKPRWLQAVVVHRKR